MRMSYNMKNVSKSFIFLILSCAIIGCTSAGEDSYESKGTQIPTCVNPAIELISTIHYLAGTGQYDERVGFPAIKGLVELFDVYESNRIKYPNIESFMPNIKEYFESCLIEMKNKKAYNSGARQIIPIS